MWTNRLNVYLNPRAFMCMFGQTSWSCDAAIAVVRLFDDILEFRACLSVVQVGVCVWTILIGVSGRRQRRMVIELFTFLTE